MKRFAWTLTILGALTVANTDAANAQYGYYGPPRPAARAAGAVARGTARAAGAAVRGTERAAARATWGPYGPAYGPAYRGYGSAYGWYGRGYYGPGLYWY